MTRKAKILAGTALASAQVETPIQKPWEPHPLSVSEADYEKAREDFKSELALLVAGEKPFEGNPFQLFAKEWTKIQLREWLYGRNDVEPNDWLGLSKLFTAAGYVKTRGHGIITSNNVEGPPIFYGADRSSKPDMTTTTVVASRGYEIVRDDITLTPEEEAKFTPEVRRKIAEMMDTDIRKLLFPKEAVCPDAETVGTVAQFMSDARRSTIMPAPDYSGIVKWDNLS